MSKQQASVDVLEGNKMVWELENDFKRFPLPICFDHGEERSELYRRHLHIQEVVNRFLRFKNRMK